VRRALQIRHAVSIASLFSLDPLSASYLSRVDMSRDQCTTVAAQNIWKSAIRSISDETAAFLKPDELAEIWNKVKSSPCYRDVPGEHRTWADLLAAVSQRNAPQIVQWGTELLASRASISDDDAAYLTTVTAAALVRLGERARARELLQAQWSRFDHAGQFDLALRELLALTRSAGTGQIAQQ
jgi:hypothetical protein